LTQRSITPVSSDAEDRQGRDMLTPIRRTRARIAVRLRLRAAAGRSRQPAG
jgi:hypothetical protein